MLALLAANKRYLSLYLFCASGGRYFAERCADRLPKASIGLSCLRFTRLASVDTAVLRAPAALVVAVVVVVARDRGRRGVAGSGVGEGGGDHDPQGIGLQGDPHGAASADFAVDVEIHRRVGLQPQLASGEEGCAG